MTSGLHVARGDWGLGIGDWNYPGRILALSKP
jgi:hypothetical protein